MQLGIVVSRAATLDVTWTTIHIAIAALARGHEVRFIEPWDLEVNDRRQLIARSHGFRDPGLTARRMVQALRRRTALRQYLRVDTLDALLLRSSPFDTTLAALAMIAESQGVAVVNSPAAMLQVQHKSWLASLPDVDIPPTLITRSRAQAAMFYDKHRKPVVVKPARGSGGHGVTLVQRRDPIGLERAFRAAQTGTGHVVVQTVVAGADAGEKRLVWMDGDILGGYLRTQAPGEFRHNLKQGGEAVPTAITPHDHAVVGALSPHLRRAGIRLAGIDLLGGKLLEINVVNPGGSFHADRLHGTDVSGQIVDRLLPKAPE